MKKQKLFKAGEVDKIDPRFIGSFDAERLLLAKKLRAESQKRYEMKVKASGNKPLKHRLIKQNMQLKAALIILASLSFFSFFM